jgi:hypothetical protein
MYLHHICIHRNSKTTPMCPVSNRLSENDAISGALSTLHGYGLTQFWRLEQSLASLPILQVKTACFQGGPRSMEVWFALRPH